MLFFFFNSRSSCCQITGGWGLGKSLNVIRSVGADKATFGGGAAAELKVGEMGREGQWAAPHAASPSSPFCLGIAGHLMEGQTQPSTEMRK